MTQRLYDALTAYADFCARHGLWLTADVLAMIGCELLALMREREARRA